ncbi:glucose-methanol-choline oxidoreductase [Xylariaceae sp. FL0255]|nr:glucose-methanol-choline oxidoreductase [Xylariaceae sp. FL0255]
MPSVVEWDYIIVGGGLAGTVIASRLLQQYPALRVLILEAGPDVSHREDILYFRSFNFIRGEFDWNYKSTPQHALNDQRIDLASGRALRGGSVVNGCKFPASAFTTRPSWCETNI